MKIGIELPDDTYTHPSLERSTGEDVTLCVQNMPRICTTHVRLLVMPRTYTNIPLRARMRIIKHANRVTEIKTILAV